MLEYFFYMLVMFEYVIQVDEYIIQIDHDTDIQKIGENVVHELLKGYGCYELKLKGLSNRTTLVLSNTRELDRVPKTK